MDFLEFLLGDRNRRGDALPGILGRFTRWIVGCGCLIVAALVVGLVAVMGGVVTFGNDAVTVIIVVVTIIFAVASLVRASLGY